MSAWPRRRLPRRWRTRSYLGCAPGSNDDYGGQPMTRFGASLEALLWGLCEYKLGKI